MTVAVEADDFTLNDPARIESIQFRDLEAGGSFVGTVAWRIYANGANDEPGAVLFSGTTSDVTHIATGYSTAGYAEFINTFQISSVSLSPGVYWLGLHNGPLSNNTNQRVYWECSSASGPRPSQANLAPSFSGVWYSHTVPGSLPELTFQLYGTIGPRVTGIQASKDESLITFTTTNGQFYRLEYKNYLNDSDWVPVSGSESVPGTGDLVIRSDSDPNLRRYQHRFYRVVLL